MVNAWVHRLPAMEQAVTTQGLSSGSQVLLCSESPRALFTQTAENILNTSFFFKRFSLLFFFPPVRGLTIRLDSNCWTQKAPLAAALLVTGTMGAYYHAWPQIPDSEVLGLA